MREIPLTKHDVYIADECFLTGTAAEVVPVVKVDGRTIGDGKPGRSHGSRAAIPRTDAAGVGWRLQTLGCRPREPVVPR